MVRWTERREKGKAMEDGNRSGDVGCGPATRDGGAAISDVNLGWCGTSLK